MKFHSKHFAAALIAGALVAGTSGAALADDDEIQLYYDEIASDAGDFTADDLSDDDLRMFLFASQSITDIRAEARELMESVSGDASESIANADASMVNAVRTAGMTPEEYRQVSYLVQNDAEVRERLQRVAGEN